MRTGELLALKRSWVDLKEGLIFVNGGVTKNREPKTAPIYGDMSQWLQKLLSRGEAETRSSVFGCFVRKVSQSRTSERLGGKPAKRPAFLACSFMTFGARLFANMIRAGVSEKVAMQISGHKTASMLWRYNITDMRYIKDAGKRTAVYLESQRKEQHAE
jgi:integrase